MSDKNNQGNTKVQRWALHYLASNKLMVDVMFTDGTGLDSCLIESFDTYTIAVRREDETIYLFKHAIRGIVVKTALLPEKKKPEEAPVEAVTA
jgi:RNA chaperone Hfq